MNALSRIKSYRRVVDIREAVESGEVIDRTAARIASGFAKKVPVEPEPPE